MIRVAETQGNTEVILFNDCSPDDSQRIIDEYAVRYPSIIRKMKSEHNLGLLEWAYMYTDIYNL